MEMVLIASYPKSGNTWVRCVIEALRRPDLQEIDLNQIQTAAVWAAEVNLIDCLSGMDVEGLSRSEAVVCRKAAYESAYRWYGGERLYMKVHDANVLTETGRLFHKGNTTGCIYIVRSPLDIVPSYAHHNAGAVTQDSVESVIAHMEATDAYMESHLTTVRDRDGRTLGLAPQPLMRWDEHVQSYLDGFDGPLLVCRYEDLHAAPLGEAKRIADFLGIDHTADDLDRACRLASFRRLADREKATGFREAPSAVPRFFRSGHIGEGAKVLSKTQRAAILRAHGATMDRLGYGAPKTRSAWPRCSS